MKMTFKQSLLASSISLILLGLVGCSDSDVQDEQDEDETSFTGLVVDGRIARGFVWVDTDSDNIIDTYEPYAYTDADGYFTYNPLTNTNYCATEGHQYCLETGMINGDYTIRVAGGVDLSTGEPFYGVLTLTGNLAEAKEIEQQVVSQGTASDSKLDFIPVISPLTSILNGLSLEEKVAMLTLIGVPGVTTENVETLLNMDFTDFAASQTDDEELQTKLALFANAFRVQKLIDVITVMLDAYLIEQGVELGLDDNGNPGIGSTAGIVTENLKEYLLDLINDNSGKGGSIGGLAVGDVDDPLAVNASNSAITDSLEDAVEKSVPEEKKSQVRSNSNTYEVTTGGLLDDVAKVTKFVSKEESTLETLQDEFEQTLVSGQVLTNSIKKQSKDLNKGSEEAKNKVNNVTNVVQSDEFKQQVQTSKDNNKNLDLQNLTVDLEVGKALEEAIANAELADAPAVGEDGIWSQRVLSMSGQSEDGERGRVLFFFGGDTAASKEGEVSVCYAFNANDNGDDIRATLLTGTWTELGSSRGVVKVDDDLVSFTIKAAKQAPIPADDIDTVVGLGDGTVSDTANYGHFRFVHDDLSEVWFSDIEVVDTTDKRDFGLADAPSIPTTNAECASFTVNGVDNALEKNLGF
jgi:hypothetical protein